MNSNFLFASSYNWLIMLVIILAAWLAIKIIRESSQQNKDVTLAKLLDSLLLTSGVAILHGCLGYFLEMKSAPCLGNILPGSSFMTIVTTVIQSAGQISSITECYIQGTSVMLTGLLVSLIIGLV